MQMLIVVVVAILVIALAIAVLGFIGPFVAVVGVVVAAFVLLNPGGLGARLRQSPGWWGIPGLRRASSRAVPFAMWLLLYTVPVPIAAFALTHAGLGGGGSAPAAVAPNAIGGGSSAPVAVTTSTPAPTPTDTLPPPSTPQPTDTPTPAPTPPPTPRSTPVPTPKPTPVPPQLCGAPDNPWNYNFCGGAKITSPPTNFCDYFTCIQSFWASTNGNVEECRDGEYSHSGGRKGACSKNGGSWRPLNQ
jgi:hypothetical protein